MLVVHQGAVYACVKSGFGEGTFLAVRRKDDWAIAQDQPTARFPVRRRTS